VRCREGDPLTRRAVGCSYWYWHTLVMRPTSHSSKATGGRHRLGRGFGLARPQPHSATSRPNQGRGSFPRAWGQGVIKRFCCSNASNFAAQGHVEHVQGTHGTTDTTDTAWACGHSEAASRCSWQQWAVVYEVTRTHCDPVLQLEAG
jgi:hypothetical protein